MKTQIQRQENVSRTIQSKTRAANQANVHSVLQKYAARSVQRQADDGLEEDMIQGRFETAQREGVEDEEPLQGKFSGTVQREESVPTKNETGIPDNMKAGFENLSGLSFDDVRVHYNSDKPVQLQALAYTQGNQVHIAPGQEKHLGHELGHVVQQKQGRVQPTMQLQGVDVNNDIALEAEADSMKNTMQMMSKNELKEKPIQLRANMVRVVQKQTYSKTVIKPEGFEEGRHPWSSAFPGGEEVIDTQLAQNATNALTELKFNDPKCMNAHMIPKKIGGLGSYPNIRPWLKTFEENNWNRNFDVVPFQNFVGGAAKNDSITYTVNTEDMTCEEAVNVVDRANKDNNLNLNTHQKNSYVDSIQKIPKSVEAKANNCTKEKEITFAKTTDCTPITDYSAPPPSDKKKEKKEKKETS